MIAWCGTALQIAGAIALASNWINPVVAYAVMTPGAVILALVNARTKDWAQFALQVTFVAINLTGIWRWAA